MKTTPRDFPNSMLGVLGAALVLGAMLMLCVAGPLSGQEPGEPGAEVPQAEFQEIVNVKVVNVIVYVRDKKTGEPITGLTIDDFELLEDKQPVKLTNFYEVAERTRTDEAKFVDDGKSQVERLRANPDMDPRQSRIPENRRLYLVVYVDHQNIRPHNRNRIFNRVREFLRRDLTREDRVALVSYNRSLKVDHGFTRDFQVISNAMYELEKHTGGRATVHSDRTDLLRQLKDAEDPGQIEGRVRLWAEEQNNDLQFTIDALDELVGNLAGIPGRKAILYVSDGLPMRPGEDLFVAASERHPNELDGIRLDALRYDNSRRFITLTNMANSNEVSFYTLDATGLLGRSMQGADVSGDYVFSTQVDSVLRHNMQDSIQFMADVTGGQSIVNTNNFSGGFERFGKDFSHYYWLGFSPSHAGNGRRYDLEVKLKPKRKNWTVRHRENYRDKSVEREMEESTLAALQFGVGGNPLGISLHPGEKIRRDDGTFMVQMGVRIPIGELVLLPREEYHVARVRVWVQARDDKGNLSDPHSQSVPITVKKGDLERALKSYYTYTLPLAMRSGDQRVTVGVRDDVGAKSSLVTRSLRIGA